MPGAIGESVGLTSRLGPLSPLHCSLKSANLLVDGEWRVKVSGGCRGAGPLQDESVGSGAEGKGLAAAIAQQASPCPCLDHQRWPPSLQPQHVLPACPARSSASLLSILCYPADFNLSRPVDASKAASTVLMTNPRWLAPCVLSGLPGQLAADVWAFGTVSWRLGGSCLAATDQGTARRDDFLFFL